MVHLIAIAVRHHPLLPQAHAAEQSVRAEDHCWRQPLPRRRHRHTPARMYASRIDPRACSAHASARRSQLVQCAQRRRVWRRHVCRQQRRQQAQVHEVPKTLLRTFAHISYSARKRPGRPRRCGPMGFGVGSLSTPGMLSGGRAVCLTAKNHGVWCGAWCVMHVNMHGVLRVACGAWRVLGGVPGRPRSGTAW